MPKPLKEPQPSSSVARLFDMGAAARAVAAAPALPVIGDTAHARPVEEVQAPELVRPLVERTLAQANANEHAPVAAASARGTGERPNQTRQIILTKSTSDAFDRLVDLYRKATDTKLTSSHVARAVFMGIAHCMESLEKEAKKIGPMKLPSNAREAELDRERFEAKLADAFVGGVRSAAAFDSEDT